MRRNLECKNQFTKEQIRKAKLQNRIYVKDYPV